MEKIEPKLTKDNHKPIFVYDEMSSSYLSYAMSVIISFLTMNIERLKNSQE